MTRILCRMVEAAPDGSLVSRVLERHRSRCLRCQADQIRTRGMSRDLGGLEAEVVPAPGGLHTRVMATLPEQDSANPRRPLLMRIVARYVAGIGVAVATLAAILGRRSRRRA